MPDENDFTVTHRREGAATVVAIAGEVDLATADAVHDEVTQARTEVRTVVLDLSGVTFMDSSGLRLLVALQRESERDGFGLTLVRGPASLQRLLELSGLAERLTMVDDVASALGGDGADPA